MKKEEVGKIHLVDSLSPVAKDQRPTQKAAPGNIYLKFAQYLQDVLIPKHKASIWDRQRYAASPNQGNYRKGMRNKARIEGRNVRNI